MGMWLKYLTVILLVIGTVVLFGLGIKPLGWIILIIGVITLFLQKDKQFLRGLSLLFGAIAVLGITPINPDISWRHIILMGLAIFSVVFIPYLISKHIHKDHHITFKFHHGRAWYKIEIAYLFLVVILSYIILPFYMKNTGAYLNWQFEPNLNSIARFFIGINVVGIWDELFFINVTLGLLKRHLNFIWANLAQAIIFSSILYEFGFKSWGFALIFIFALAQGYVFKRTQSLLYIIAVHLSLDFVLFLVLLNAHNPDWIPIFITSGI